MANGHGSKEEPRRKSKYPKDFNVFYYEILLSPKSTPFRKLEASGEP